MRSNNAHLQLSKVKPLNDRQRLLLSSTKNIIAHGAAGTGKTYLALYKALSMVEKRQLERVIVMRSAVPTRNIGFLPGSVGEKTKVYEAPYADICQQLYEEPKAYGILKGQKKIEFITTSYIRGLSTDNCFIIVDEFQNLNFHELDSIITRLGKNCRIAFVGDGAQSDLQDTGINEFLDIIERMPDLFDRIEFSVEDIVRSHLVKRYLTEKHLYAQSSPSKSNLLGSFSRTPKGTSSEANS